MTYLSTQFCFLTSLLVSIASCSGQVNKTSVIKDHEVLIGRTEQRDKPKLVRSNGVESSTVLCELQDKAGNLWFSIDGEGVYRYDGKSFKNFTSKDGLNSNGVGPVIEDKKGNILLGTKKGICKYDGRSFSKYLETDSLSITCLLEDRDGNLWFGTMGNGVYRYDGKTLSNFLNNDDHKFNLGVHHQVILDILQDKGGNIWFSSWNGGGVWRYDGKSFVNFLPGAEYYRSKEDQRSFISSAQPANFYEAKISQNVPQDHITDDMIFSIAEDNKGNLWFATRRHGACRYNGKTFTNFREEEGFVSNGVYAILQDHDGAMWFTTDKNGVYRYDGKTFQNYTTTNGLVNNAVVSILADKNGNLWFGTKWFGLSRFDGQKFTNFSGEEYK